MRLTSSIASLASEFTFILSAEGEITYVSPTAQYVLKCTEEVCSHELFSFVHHEDIPLLMEKLHTIYATKEKRRQLTVVGGRMKGILYGFICMPTRC